MSARPIIPRGPIARSVTRAINFDGVGDVWWTSIKPSALRRAIKTPRHDVYVMTVHEYRRPYLRPSLRCFVTERAPLLGDELRTA